jgi:hypothetical protein
LQLATQKKEGVNIFSKRGGGKKSPKTGIDARAQKRSTDMRNEVRKTNIDIEKHNKKGKHGHLER